MPPSLARWHGPNLSVAAASGRLVEAAFDAAGRRWTPLLDYADENGVDVCYEFIRAKIS